jgi:hypothetical protein
MGRQSRPRGAADGRSQQLAFATWQYGVALAPIFGRGVPMRYVWLAFALLISAACHPGPVVDSNPAPAAGGTIAGMVSTTDSTVAVPGRKVTAIEVNKGERFDATTGTNGGYTIKVPGGTYRLEIELRESETLSKRPDQTHVNNGDLDPGRDFVITIRSARQ